MGLQFGKYKRTAQPGFNWVCCCAGVFLCHWHWHWLLCNAACGGGQRFGPAAGEALAGTLSLRVQQLDVR